MSRSIINNGKTYILGIESSCDETAASVVVDGRYVLSNVIFSQIDIHRRYGGVVPEIASRNHVEKITEVVDEALINAGVTMEEIDGIAVTYGPGLVGALLVGLSFAKALSFSTGKPLVGVHHIEGHICANYIEHKLLEPPFVCLVVSGGHTHLVNVYDFGKYEILGKTRDDAAGEAYDKVARALGLTYPGGVEIDKLSKIGDCEAITFPRVMLEADSFDFSFSGLKSAVLNYLNQAQMMSTEIIRENVAASFQKAVIDVLVAKSVHACEKTGSKKLALAGGVSANSTLRAEMQSACDKAGIELFIPSPVFCTDNAAMIASCGYFDFIKGKFSELDLNAYPNLVLS